MKENLENSFVFRKLYGKTVKLLKSSFLKPELLQAVSNTNKKCRAQVPALKRFKNNVIFSSIC